MVLIGRFYYAWELVGILFEIVLLHFEKKLLIEEIGDQQSVSESVLLHTNVHSGLETAQKQEFTY